MANIFTTKPQRGDLEVRRLSDCKPFYITADSLTPNEIDTSEYEIIGPVIFVEGKKVLVAYKTNASKTWCDVYRWKLSGYTLDNTSRSGVISIRETSSSSANTDYTVNYKASSVAELVSQLNDFFKATAIFVTQDWYAYAEGTTIILQCKYTFWQQASYDVGKTGFALTAYLLPDVTALANIRRRHGGKGGEGAISSFERALVYFRSDNSSTNYNPNATVTDIKRTYPVCLPGYLGTSQYQSDKCALLRSVYGEGEEGWRNFMASCLPVVNTDFGNFGQDFGREMTALLAGERYKSNTLSERPMCQAASYCYELATPTIEKGEFYLPTVKELYRILDGIKYNTTASREADVVNKTLLAIGGSALSNSSNMWSCCRCTSSNAWFAYGSYGFFASNLMCYSSLAVPLSLHKL